jgi:hypothetical protein
VRQGAVPAYTADRPAALTPPTAEPAAPRRVLVRTEPGEKPGWVDAIPKNADELYFTGVSRAFSSAADARNAARENAFNQVLKYYGEYIQASSVEKRTTAGNTANTLNSYLEKEEDITRFAQAVVSQVGADRYYTEIYLSDNGEEYVVYVLCQIPRAKAEADIQNFARNVSERYGSLLSSQQTLGATLKMYAGVVETLAQNPLHRAVAYYPDGQAGGRAGLYEYCRLQIDNLAHSVSFAPLPSQTVEKGETLNTRVSVVSNIIPSIGNIPCRVMIAGRNNPAPTVFYTAGEDNSFVLPIHTGSLEEGRYLVQLELMLSETAPGITRNPSGGFSFEVRPLNTVRISGGEDGPLGGTVAEILQRAGLMVVSENGAYRARINIDMNENKTPNYYTVEPVLTITVELERDGTPLVTYTKEYPLFRHVTRGEAYNRAYRNIEQDLSGNFADRIRSLGK